MNLEKEIQDFIYQFYGAVALHDCQIKPEELLDLQARVVRRFNTLPRDPAFQIHKTNILIDEIYNAGLLRRKRKVLRLDNARLAIRFGWRYYFNTQPGNTKVSHDQIQNHLFHLTTKLLRNDSWQALNRQILLELKQNESAG